MKYVTPGFRDLMTFVELARSYRPAGQQRFVNLTELAVFFEEAVCTAQKYRDCARWIAELATDACAGAVDLIHSDTTAEAIYDELLKATQSADGGWSGRSNVWDEISDLVAELVVERCAPHSHEVWRVSDVHGNRIPQSVAN